MQLDFRLEWPGVFEKRVGGGQDQRMNGNGHPPADGDEDVDEGNVSGAQFIDFN